MSTRTRILLIAAVVLVVALYAVSAGAGGAGRGEPGRANGVLTWLAGLPGANREISPGLVSGDCLAAGGAIRVAGTCRLRVADPGATRMLTLRGRVRFRVTTPDLGTADVTPDDEGTAQTSVAVDRPAEIVIACDPACDLTLGGSHG